jgi:chromosomal replication initiator protein
MNSLLGIWEEFVNIATLGNSLDKAILSKVKLDFTSNEVRILVNDEFTKTWIENNYLDRIKSLYEHYDMKVVIVLSKSDSEKQPEEKETKIQKKSTKNETKKTTSILEAEPEVKVSDSENKNYGNLNPKYTFSNFVVGPSNEFAYHAALNVARIPGGMYNPLFIYGGVGLGKTHLLQAIAHEVISKNKLKKVMYVTSEQFINDFFKAMNEKNLHSFRLKYREADVLLIDDVQFFKSSMKQVMEELFHTFNKLFHDRKQMVFSSDRAPKELEEFSDRMKSRFESGLIVYIDKPDLETRLKIVEAKFRSEGIDAPEDVINFIANNITDNVRSLESTVLKVIAYTSFSKKPIELKTVKDILSENSGTKSNGKQEEQNPESQIIITYTIDEIIEAVTSYYEISKEDIFNGSKQDGLIMARNLIIYIAKRITNMSFSQIGEVLNRTHSTILRAYEKTESLLRKDLLLREQLKEILTLLKSKKNVA